MKPTEIRRVLLENQEAKSRIGDLEKQVTDARWSKKQFMEQCAIQSMRIKELEAENVRLNGLIEQARTAIEPVRDASGTWVDHIVWLVEREKRLMKLLDAGDELANHAREAKEMYGVDGEACVLEWKDAKAALSGEPNATKEEG